MKTGQSLTQRLAVLDKERQAVILEIKKTPAYALTHIKQVLNGFIDNNKAKWFARSNEKGETAYFKLVSFEILPTTTVVKEKFAKKRVAAEVETTKHGSVLAKIKTKWEKYPYGEIVKVNVNEEHNISIFNDIDGQILNGRKLAEFNEKKLLKDSLDSKKKKLEEELKKVKADIAAIK